MAVITLSIPDETFARYQAMHSQNPNHAIIKQLERFQDLPYKDRSLVFTPEQRGKIEAMFGEPIDASSVDRFLEWVRQRALVNVGGVEVVLTAGQLKRAEANGRFWKSHDGQTNPDHTRDFIHAQVKTALTNALGI